jgi:hypothetical protein
MFGNPRTCDGWRTYPPSCDPHKPPEQSPGAYFIHARCRFVMTTHSIIVGANGYRFYPICLRPRSCHALSDPASPVIPWVSSARKLSIPWGAVRRRATARRGCGVCIKKPRHGCRDPERMFCYDPRAGRCKKSFWGVEPKFLEPLLRFARSDVRDHIGGSKIDQGPP